MNAETAIISASSASTHALDACILQWSASFFFSGAHDFPCGGTVFPRANPENTRSHSKFLSGDPKNSFGAHEFPHAWHKTSRAASKNLCGTSEYPCGDAKFSCV